MLQVTEPLHLWQAPGLLLTSSPSPPGTKAVLFRSHCRDNHKKIHARSQQTEQTVPAISSIETHWTDDLLWTRKRGIRCPNTARSGLNQRLFPVQCQHREMCCNSL